jgi:hypothetical protein
MNPAPFLSRPHPLNDRSEVLFASSIFQDQRACVVASKDAADNPHHAQSERGIRHPYAICETLWLASPDYVRLRAIVLTKLRHPPATKRGRRP